jgi:hypothetical protein
MNVKKLKLIATFLLFSSNSMADSVERPPCSGRPQWNQENINETFDCGNLPLSSCLSGVNKMTTEYCSELVADETPYDVDNVTSSGNRVTKAMGYTNTGPFDYDIDVLFGCHTCKVTNGLSVAPPVPVTGANFLCVVGSTC